MRGPLLVGAGVLVGLALGPSCALMEHQGGIMVAISLAHERASDPADAWLAAGGARVTLAEAYVTVTAIELVRCDATAAATRRPGWAAELGFGGVARAHTHDTPTRLGVPVVEDLLAPSDAPRALGMLAAPPGRYCSVRVTVGPADSDALGLAAQPDVLGASGLFAGQVEDAGGTRALHATCATGRTFEVGVAPFEVSADQRDAALVVSLDTTLLYDGVDVSPGAAGIGCAALANLR